MNDSLETAARMLELSEEFRVLRRLNLSDHLSPDDGSPTRTGVFFDIECTGLHFSNSEVIELAIIPFEYSPDGRIFSTGKPVHQFNEPEKPIPKEIISITGITDEIVSGHHINLDEVETTARSASLVIAHNAAFDRPFAERISPIFASKPWGCTMCDVPWNTEGIEGRRLSDLLAQFRYFFDAHRAIDDCEAGISLLTMLLQSTGERVLERLLQTARQHTWRVFADGAPFDAKEILRLRGYRWNPERVFGPRAWWIELAEDRIEDELAFLKEQIFESNVDVPMFEITAFQRYSSRVR